MRQKQRDKTEEARAESFREFAELWLEDNDSAQRSALRVRGIVSQVPGWVLAVQ